MHSRWDEVPEVPGTCKQPWAEGAEEGDLGEMRAAKCKMDLEVGGQCL